MGDWDEDKHPRDDKGRFGSGGGLDKWAEKQSGSGIREANVKDFQASFKSAFPPDSPFKNHVTHYSAEELGKMKLFLSSDGKAGVAVHDHGDGRIEATALFNQGGEKGIGLKLLQHAIDKAGVNYVECYGPQLNQLYAKVGFEVKTEDKFNPEYAAKDWDYKMFPAEQTHYFTMTLKKK